ncbi:hypothetical protein [Kitasatospora cheerisanensis]|uniref:Uncharacterized protein n=1 Tax=Kitasatospora cheerisanensis KCTC 2395 TaxID=1348663 RepID=A0A066YRD1_9ACTN|nr:hypothetical protein [Kitasatospora cheerisanensis]KDN80490.1 hypothetical protein KCH_77240 [Kitasatospora cheerisanensis KCTC 2395]
MTSTQLSVGGLALGLALLLATALRWWRQGFPLPDALALAGGLLSGLLAALCSGGLLGLATHLLVTRATNPLGNKALGHDGGQLLAHPGEAGLTRPGGVATLLLVVATVLLWRCCDARLRAQIGTGVLSGSALGLAAGVSGLAAITLVPVVNAAGAQFLGALQ